MASMDAREATLAMLAKRARGSTVCPSEVARALVGSRLEQAPSHWRDAMPAVHAAVDRLVTQGLVRLSWKGKMLSTRSGPYRIGRLQEPTR